MSKQTQRQNPKDFDSEMFTQAEAAEYLGVSTSTLRQGHINPPRFGEDRLYKRKHLDLINQARNGVDKINKLLRRHKKEIRQLRESKADLKHFLKTPEAYNDDE